MTDPDDTARRASDYWEAGPPPDWAVSWPLLAAMTAAAGALLIAALAAWGA